MKGTMVNDIITLLYKRFHKTIKLMFNYRHIDQACMGVLIADHPP